MPAPPGHTVSRPIGVITVRDTPTAGTRPYAFVITEDSHVWANMWDAHELAQLDEKGHRPLRSVATDDPAAGL
ncbi:hypothetical protein SLUN_04570 [Streptomyces lunaelactis]|uniref:Uncharacterized protein n=1 Tax=Streptomyces lunaelactis TaxID=1535768 RepID=A0A2R4SXJ0_9ACTN|nr:hypothetical protein [Streptomyces lunaelactis]AVZ71579.1 hypothetical protein SLUN_04570 [Streptomyces lunaelactis]NUK84094.1 hypothetical protein [Streptomyces lunaelactis]NUL03041.1 hypothetical protein [Streptomyces lunaelactis]